MKHNYHTHHELCRHARGTAEDYVKEALKADMKVIGFSDHAPSRMVNDERMSFEELETYLADIRDVKARYIGRITIHTGLEIEYLDPDYEYYRNLKEKVEYFILGQHFIPSKSAKNGLRGTIAITEGEELIQYAKSVEKALSTGLFELVAHPDIYMGDYPTFDAHAKEAAEIIAEASLTYDVPLEFNANGVRKGLKAKEDGLHYRYPRKEFWDIARQKGCKILLSADAHAPTHLHDRAIRKSEALIWEWDLTIRETLIDL